MGRGEKGKPWEKGSCRAKRASKRKRKEYMFGVFKNSLLKSQGTMQQRTKSDPRADQGERA